MLGKTFRLKKKEASEQSEQFPPLPPSVPALALSSLRSLSRHPEQRIDIQSRTPLAGS